MSNLPERRLTSQQMEAVIRRAVELQEARPNAEGISEDELLRMGGELGLSPAHLRQAMLEVQRSGETAETGLVGRMFGTASVAASRAVPGEARVVRERIERYLLDVEYMEVRRRFPNRTLYVRGAGMMAAVGRATARMATRQQRLDFRVLEVAVEPLEEGFAHVAVATELKGERAGFAAGGLIGGGASGSAVATALGIAVAPPAALLGLPVLLGMFWGTRTAYQALLDRRRADLETFLDRVQHDELARPAATLRLGR